MIADIIDSFRAILALEERSEKESLTSKAEVQAESEQGDSMLPEVEVQATGASV